MSRVEDKKDSDAKTLTDGERKEMKRGDERSSGRGEFVGRVAYFAAE